MLLLSGLSVFAQVDIKSPTATEFVKYQRIPVSYFNGLPSINIPLYCSVERYGTPSFAELLCIGHQGQPNTPTYVGLGWNLSAGGCITRVINGSADETICQDQEDMTGVGWSGECWKCPLDIIIHLVI